jgi:hypothetical protein
MKRVHERREKELSKDPLKALWYLYEIEEDLQELYIKKSELEKERAALEVLIKTHTTNCHTQQ